MKRFRTDHPLTKPNRKTTMLSIGLLCLFVCINLIAPMGMLLVRSVDFKPFYKGFQDILSGAATKKALWNSIKISCVSCLISVSCAFFYAFIVEFKLRGKTKKIFSFISILPMLVPSITHGLVIIYLFGKMGIFTRLTGIQLPVYGSLGIIMGSFFYSFPIAFLILSQAFANLDGRLFENATVLGVHPFRRFYEIVLPIMKYSIFSSFAVCFSMVFTDYGIPLSVGGTYSILPILFYKNVVGLLDFSKGAIYSILILLPAAGVYLLDVLYFSKRQVSSANNIIPVKSGPFHILQKIAFLILTAVLIIPVLLIVVTPFITAWPYNLKPTLDHFIRIIKVGTLVKLIRNSVWIALCTGILGTIIAFFAGYIYIRNQDGMKGAKKAVHGLYMVSLAVPGLALGLSYAMLFRGSFLYNTLMILILVNIVHFFGSPYMMVISHFKLLNPNLEAICKTLGGNRYHAFVDVIIPNSKKMLLDIFVYFFTNTMITISAVSLLYNTKTMTLALQITAYNDQGMWESAVAVSLVILFFNTVMKLTQVFRTDTRKVEKSALS